MPRSTKLSIDSEVVVPSPPVSITVPGPCGRNASRSPARSHKADSDTTMRDDSAGFNARLYRSSSRFPGSNSKLITRPLLPARWEKYRALSPK